MELQPHILEPQPHIGWGEIEIKANSAQLKLEFGLSLATKDIKQILRYIHNRSNFKIHKLVAAGLNYNLLKTMLNVRLIILITKHLNLGQTLYL